MITLTKTAAEQILKSFEPLTDDDKSVLRIAVEQKPNGDFHYIMGLDDPKPDDIRFISNDVNVAISDTHNALTDKLEVDYIEIKPDEFNFIFKNPNDPKYKKPTN